MKCFDPAEQSFELKDRLIGIDWGKNGDKAIQMTLKKEEDGKLAVIEIKELPKEL